MASPDIKTAPPETQEPKKAMSKGEKLFNWMTYGGIAGVGAFAATIPIAFHAKYGKWSDKFKASSKWLQRYMSERNAEDTLITTATMQGGNITLFPVAIAEHYKEPIVNALNKTTGDTTEPLEKKDETKQSWKSLLKSRLLAWATVFVSIKSYVGVFGGEKFDAFEKSFSKNIWCKLRNKATHIGGQETKNFQIGRIAAIDFFATTAASILLYAGSRMFARKDPAATETLADDVKAAFVIDDDPPKTSTRTTLPARTEGFAEAIAGQKLLAETSPKLGLGA